MPPKDGSTTTRSRRSTKTAEQHVQEGQERSAKEMEGTSGKGKRRAKPKTPAIVESSDDEGEPSTTGPPAKRGAKKSGGRPPKKPKTAVDDSAKDSDVEIVDESLGGQDNGGKNAEGGNGEAEGAPKALTGAEDGGDAGDGGKEAEGEGEDDGNAGKGGKEVEAEGEYRHDGQGGGKGGEEARAKKTKATPDKKGEEGEDKTPKTLDALMEETDSAVVTVEAMLESRARKASHMIQLHMVASSADLGFALFNGAGGPLFSDSHAQEFDDLILCSKKHGHV
ncbi:hypothetical protein CC1G_10467 [Coprinopsis cinerea okayama7|nr:hypothetical protein CC1G_10467 [Coprinopsis cinerea okayama7\|eukprot:XP_001834593.1 hypothetical protein CC1G_10467 [Coprinopsis cinerea okayama7\